MAAEAIWLCACFVMGACAGNAVWDAEHRQWPAFVVDVAVLVLWPQREVTSVYRGKAAKNQKGVVVAGMAVVGR